MGDEMQPIAGVSVADFETGFEIQPIVSDSLNFRKPQHLNAEYFSSVPTYQTLSASNSSTSNINISLNTTSTQELERRMYFKFNARFSFSGMTGTGGKTPLALGSYDALRDFPLHSCSDSASIVINGQSENYEPRSIIHELGRCIQDKDKKFYSGCPSMPDFYQNYSDALTVSNARNPLLVFPNGIDQGRGAFNYSVVSNAVGATSAVVDVEWFEPILAPYLLSPDQENDRGFYGVRQLQVKYTMSNLSFMWSHDATNSGVGIGALSVTFNSPPELYYRQKSLLNMVAPISNQIYGWREFEQNTSGQQTVSNGANASFSLATKDVQKIPKYHYIYCGKDSTLKNQNESSHYAQLVSINIKYNGAPVLSSASLFDLYSISVENGLNMSFEQWKRYTGSLLILSPANLGMPGDELSVIGQLKTFSIAVDAVYKNISGASQDYKMYVINAYDNLLEYRLYEGTFHTYTAPFDNIEISNLAWEVWSKSEVVERGVGMGLIGGFSLKHLFRRAKHFFKHLPRNIVHGLRTADNVVNAAKNVIGDVADVTNLARQKTGGGFMDGNVVGGRSCGGYVGMTNARIPLLQYVERKPKKKSSKKKK